MLLWSAVAHAVVECGSSAVECCCGAWRLMLLWSAVAHAVVECGRMLLWSAAAHAVVERGSSCCCAVR